MTENNLSYDSLNTNELSSTSSLNESDMDEDNSIYEFELSDGSTKFVD